MLNDDNDESRRAVELCYRTSKTLVNPIIDWDESEVWEFLNEVVRVPHCCLYDEGFKRLGCIGCPMGTTEKRKREFERYPTYKRAYLRAFEKMLKKTSSKNWETADDVMKWWLQEEDDGKQPDMA